MDLSTTLAGIHLPTCLYNASGPRSGTAAALNKVAASAAGAVLTKSATLESQTGNPQPRTWHSPDDVASLNSEGLPNNGIDYYISEETYQETMEGISEKKPFIVSLSGKTLADNLEMMSRIQSKNHSQHIAAIELNLACPNVIGKPIIAYDFDQMSDILSAVAEVANHLPPIGVKLPPYFDFTHFQMAADILNRHKSTIRYVCTINTLGNATAVDIHSEAPVISSNHGFAGLSGPAVRYTALANVRKLRSLLDPAIDVVGMGGIGTGQELFEFILCGATACQIATAHWKEGPAAFDRILNELQEIMQNKGYSSIPQFRGKLQEWSKEGAAKSRTANSQSSTAPRKTIPPGSDNLYKALALILLVINVFLLVERFFRVTSSTNQEL